ncbi:MAG: SAM-dependent methyltransferase [Armatimonadota bacterium]
MLTIVGLGPAGIGGISASALLTLESATRVYMRTGRHPAALDLRERGVRFETFDHIYETASDFDEVYSTIAARVIEESRAGDIAYAVPGHPLVAERSVALILDTAPHENIPVELIGSASFIDACLEALAMPIGRGLKIIDALALDEVLPSIDCPNLIHQVYDRMVASSVKLALMEIYPDEFEVYVISGAGGDDAKVMKLPLYELDRREYDHLTSVFVPEL